MKKVFFLFITLCIILLPACSDDESWNVKHGKEISKVYREPNLKMTLNGKEVKGKSALFLSSDLTVANIVLINTIPGEDSLSFSKVKLTDTGKDNIYAFRDSTINDDRKIYFEGRIGSGLTIDVKHEVTSPVVGYWIPDSEPIVLNIVPKNPTDKVFLNGFYTKTDSLYIVNPPGVEGDDFVTVIKNFGNLASLFVVDLGITTEPDHDMSVRWKIPKINIIPGIPTIEGETEKGLIIYNVHNSKLYPALPSLDDMLASASISDLASSGNLTLEEVMVLLNLGQKAYKGLPLPIDISQDQKKLKITITREMLEPYMQTLVKVLVPLLENLDLSEAGTAGSMLGITNESLVAFVSELGRIVDESQEFEMYISLKRSTKKSADEAPVTKEDMIRMMKHYIENPNIEIQ